MWYKFSVDKPSIIILSIRTAHICKRRKIIHYISGATALSHVCQASGGIPLLVLDSISWLFQDALIPSKHKLCLSSRHILSNHTGSKTFFADSCQVGDTRLELITSFLELYTKKKCVDCSLGLKRREAIRTFSESRFSLRRIWDVVFKRVWLELCSCGNGQNKRHRTKFFTEWRISTGKSFVKTYNT